MHTVVPHLTLTHMTCFPHWALAFVLARLAARARGTWQCLEDRWCVRFSSRDIMQELWVSPWLHVLYVWTCKCVFVDVALVLLSWSLLSFYNMLTYIIIRNKHSCTALVLTWVVWGIERWSLIASINISTPPLLTNAILRLPVCLWKPFI